MSLELVSDGGDAAAVARSIASIHVVRLHGKFTYELDIAPDHRAPAADDVTAVTEDRLTLLYGKNGTGKTSLLRLLFHALSPADNRGHRTAMQRVRFREFAVFLTDGSFVRYGRGEEEDVGPLLAEVRVGDSGDPARCEFGGDREKELPFVVDAQTSLPVDELPASADMSEVWRFARENLTLYSRFERDRDRFLTGLRALDINPVFLEDNRAITSDVLDADDTKRLRASRRARAIRAGSSRAELEDETSRRREVDIEEALERVRIYLSQLAFAGTQAGSARVDTVYVNVAGAIIEHSSKVGRPRKGLVPELRAAVAALNDRAARFQAYGLLPESPMVELAERLEGAEDRHGPLLEQVLQPHLDGFGQRLDALEPGLAAVSAFVDALNSFLESKRVEFSPGREGIRIIDDLDEQQIHPSNLSSGEKQIVLLFSDIIALQDETKLFLIDEPELSLNPDWQRALMPSLLGVTEASGMQVLAATHSIEIMARYRDRRRELLTIYE